MRRKWPRQVAEWPSRKRKRPLVSEKLGMNLEFSFQIVGLGPVKAPEGLVLLPQLPPHLLNATRDTRRIQLRLSPSYLAHQTA